MNEKIITIPIEEVYDSAEKYMAIMNGYNREGKAAEKSREKAMKTRTELFDGLSMDVLLANFTNECIEDTDFVFDGERIQCKKLPGIDKESVVGGYVFMFHAPMPDLSQFPISKQYLADSWQTAFVDVGRDVIRKKVLEMAEQEYDKKLYITDTIAPGMYGIDGSKTKNFFRFMNADKIELGILESGMMVPVKSFVGIFLVLNRDTVIQTMDCSECLSGGKMCEYCKNFAERYI